MLVCVGGTPECDEQTGIFRGNLFDARLTVFICGDAAESGIAFPKFDHMIRYGSDRYFFGASCFFVYCLALVVEAIVPRRKVSALIFAGLFIVSGIVNFRIGPLSDMNWQQSAWRIDAWVRCRER